MKTILITLTCLFISTNCFCQKSIKRGDFYILDKKKISKARYTKPRNLLPNTGYYINIKIGGRILDSINYNDIRVILTNWKSKEFYSKTFSRGITHIDGWTSKELAEEHNKKYEEEEERNKMQKQGDYYIFELPLGKFSIIYGSSASSGYVLKKGKYYVRLKYEDPKTNKIYITNKMKLILE